MSKRKFVLVATLFFIIVGGIYAIYCFVLRPDIHPLGKIILGIITLIIETIVLINYYKKNVK